MTPRFSYNLIVTFIWTKNLREFISCAEWMAVPFLKGKLFDVYLPVYAAKRKTHRFILLSSLEAIFKDQLTLIDI